MRSSRLLGAIVLGTLLAVTAGCGSVPLLESKKIDYKSAGKLPPLEVPPDLTVPGKEDRFAVPDAAPQGSATFSAFSKERGAQPQADSSALLPKQDKARIERAGTQRWLVVNAAPEQVWPVVKEFWQESGFILKLESPDAGVMETDWAENRAKIPQDPIRNVLSKVLDSLYSTSERDKFRTRLERGSESGTTEIYISHRGMVEVLEGNSNRTMWQPRPADLELEAEMLQRLMVRFGVDEARAKTQVAAQAAPERAMLGRGADGMVLNEPFDRAWRRVGLALDRIGFTVEDRDRAQGLYFVRYVDPELDNKKEEKGFLSKLAFWRGSSAAKDKQAQYRIRLSGEEGRSRLQVLDKGGAPDTSETANRILGLLYEQLK